MRYRSESPSMHYTTTTTAKQNDYRTPKQSSIDPELSRSFSPQYNSSQDDIYKSSSLYTTKREEVNFAQNGPIHTIASRLQVYANMQICLIYRCVQLT